MSATTGIQWCDSTWNPVVGCTQVSPGCAHCYAKSLHDMRHAASLAGKMAAPQYREPFEVVQIKPDRLTAPLSWRAPRRIFVNSVSDLFHDDVPASYIARVFAVMSLAERHTFQVLTKRPARMQRLLSSTLFWDTVIQFAEEYYDRTGWTADDSKSYEEWVSWINESDIIELPNVWLGVSVENQHFADERIPLLLQTPAAVRFLSCEPLLGPVDFSDIPGPFNTRFDALDDSTLRSAIDWVIVGGESGPKARPFNIAWARQIVADCKKAAVAVFVKQMGTAPFHDVDGQHYPVSFGRHGDDFAGFEEALRVREFPQVQP